MNAVKEKAYAKINLHLDVVSKRDDGFHNIKTVMHSVSLYDSVTVSIAPSKEISVKLCVEGAKFLPTDSKNLAYRAARLFLERLGVGADVKIKLVKRIPVSAGLAGGSSDAAAVLKALNKLYKRPFTTKALLNMGEELGSDVPYCILGKTALCEGRGEKMTSLDTDIKLNFIIANAKEHVSTPEAYRALDEKYSNFDGSVANDGENVFPALLEMLKTGIFNKTAFFNIFEEPVLSSCERSSKLKERLTELGAECVMMSGSGPSLFAVFKDKEASETARNTLIDEDFYAWCAESV